MMENSKAEIIAYLQTLPEDSSLEDIMHHLYVRKKIQQGLDDVHNGSVLSHEEMMQQIKIDFKLGFNFRN